jgi:hypothetical protein
VRNFKACLRYGARLRQNLRLMLSFVKNNYFAQAARQGAGELSLGRTVRVARDPFRASSLRYRVCDPIPHFARAQLPAQFRRRLAFA